MSKSQLEMAKELAKKSIGDQRMKIPAGEYEFTIGRNR